MVIFFLILSLLFNILAFLAIVILYLRQSRFIQAEKKQEKMIQEMEEVISAYMIEMKEENEKFINRLQEISLNKETAFINRTSEMPTPNISDLHSDGTSKERSIRIGKVAPFQAVKAYKKNMNNSDLSIEKSNSSPLTDGKQSGSQNASVDSENHFQDQNIKSEQKDDYLMSLLNEVFSLKKEGFSVEEIAKKLNKGKTEIELLLKFNHQNEQE